MSSRAIRDCWQFRNRAGRGGGREYHFTSLPAETQAALVRALPEPANGEPADEAPRATGLDYDREALWAWAERRPGSLRARGEARAEALRQVMRLVDAGRTLSEAFNAVALAQGLPEANLRRWYYGSKDKPGARRFAPCDWAAALIPSYTGRTAFAPCSAGAWEYFKAEYLRLECPSGASVYERLQRAARKHGWTVPALITLLRRLRAEIGYAAMIKARHGEEALKRIYPCQERDHAVLGALEAVNADGHKFDVFARWPDGEIARPVMVAWQDIYSAKILSFRVDKTENTDAVRLSFGDLAERFGLPEHAYLDNGRGFASKWMTGGVPNRYRFKVKEEEPAGILKLVGVAVHWTTPYHGQAKPIERAFRDFCDYIAKHPAFAGAYTGNSPSAKPESYQSRAVPIEKFLDILGQEVDAHNQRLGRRSPVAQGRSFDAVFKESYESRPIRKATQAQRRLWLLAAERVLVRADGTVALTVDRRNRYKSNALYAYKGTRVVVRFDPQDLHSLVHVETSDGRYIGAAECMQVAGYGDSQAAREHAKSRKRWMRATKERLKAELHMDALEAAKLLPRVEASDEPEAQVVRLARPVVALVEPPRPSPMSADEEEACRRIAEDMARRADGEPEPETERDVFLRWRALDERLNAGAALDDEERQFWKGYQMTPDFEAQRQIDEDFKEAFAQVEAQAE